MKKRPTMNFKFIELQESLAKIAGSAQPGGKMPPEHKMKEIIDALKEGKSFEEAGVPERLISNLGHIYDSGIKIIYNFTTISNPLTQYLWEKYFEGTYITELEGTSIAIDNFSVTTIEKMNKIIKHIKSNLEDNINVLVHCEGGLGRTGTVLSAIHMLINVVNNADEAIAYIRHKYSKDAVEGDSQVEFLRSFSNHHFSKTSSLLEENNDKLECNFGYNCIVMSVNKIIYDNQTLNQKNIFPWLSLNPDFDIYNFDPKAVIRLKRNMEYVGYLNFNSIFFDNENVINDNLISKAYAMWNDLGFNILGTLYLLSLFSFESF